MNQALTLKEEVGLNKIAEGGKVYSALLPAVSLLAEELKKVVVYYQNHALYTHGGSAVIEEIFLLGGDANLFGLDTFFSSFLKIPVGVADPFASIKGRLITPFPPIPKNQALKFSTASGLALRGLLRNTTSTAT
jgi:Tfp pilus assembly PilM family ATPase